MFPEVLPHPREVFEAAVPGTEHVITRYRKTDQNLRTQSKRIIRKTPLGTWPKLFQNLRSGRQTELADQFPQQVVCKWIGNSEPVAAEHYLQVTNEHFERAAITGVEPVPRAAQNPVQHARADLHGGKHRETDPR